MSTKSNGHILVEVLVAMAIFAIIASAILGGFVSAREGKVAQKQNLIAKGYVDQAVEALRSIRERDWNLVAVNGAYYPRLTGSTWTLETPPHPQGELVDGFRRQIVLSGVYRDSLSVSGNVVPTGGMLDPASKKAVITVSWGLLPTQKLTTTQYLTRYSNNDRFEHTLYRDFSDGVLLGTIIKCDGSESCGDTADSEIELAPGGFGNWCNPSQMITTVNLSRQGVPTTVSAVRAEDSGGTWYNRVFAGTGGNASGTPFTSTKITGNGEEIVAEAIGDLMVSPQQKANAVFGYGEYAYIVTDKAAQALMIVDLNRFISTTPPLYDSPVGTFNSGDSKDAISVYVAGDTAYVTTNKLYILNVEDKTAPALLSTYTLDGVASRIVVKNNIAYVALTGSATKLQLVDVSDPIHPVQFTGGSGGKLVDASLASVRDVYVNSSGTRAYIVTDRSDSKQEFFIVNTYTKNTPRLVNGGSYEAGINATGIAVVANDSIAVIVGKNGSDTHPEYQVVDIFDESSVALCTSGGPGTFRVPEGIFGISAVYQPDDGHAYSYVVTGDTEAELKIIEGGTGGSGGGGGYNGIFESEILDPFTEDVQFNRFNIDADYNNGHIYTWVAAYQPENGSCSLEESARVYPYVGIDGTDSTYFEGSGTVPFFSSVPEYTNPAKCFRYKVRLSTSLPGTTPVFRSIKVNYSP